MDEKSLHVPTVRQQVLAVTQNQFVFHKASPKLFESSEIKTRTLLNNHELPQVISIFPPEKLLSERQEWPGRPRNEIFASIDRPRKLRRTDERS